MGRDSIPGGRCLRSMVVRSRSRARLLPQTPRWEGSDRHGNLYARRPMDSEHLYRRRAERAEIRRRRARRRRLFAGGALLVVVVAAGGAGAFAVGGGSK